MLVSAALASPWQVLPALTAPWSCDARRRAIGTCHLDHEPNQTAKPSRCAEDVQCVVGDSECVVTQQYQPSGIVETGGHRLEARCIARGNDHGADRSEHQPDNYENSCSDALG